MPADARWLRIRTHIARAAAALGFLITLLTIASWGGRLGWPVELATHFRVQYAVLLALVSLVLAVLARFRIAGFFALMIVPSAAAIFPLYVSPGRPPDIGARMSRLRFMTANIHTDNRRYKAFVDHVRDVNPDVLLVLEVDQAWVRGLAPLRPRYPYRWERPLSDNFGIALYSKLRAISIEGRELGGVDVPAVLARLRVDGGSLAVIGMHTLPPTRPRYSNYRDRQLKAAAELASDLPGPLILAGDLNITGWSPLFNDLLRDGGLTDSRRGFGVQSTWPSQAALMRIPIDHVLVSPGVHIFDRRVHPGLGSDHRSVVVDLGLIRPPLHKGS